MGAITIVAVYQAFLKYPDYGTKLSLIKHQKSKEEKKENVRKNLD